MIKWSYSSLKQYKTCPRQYYEIRVAKNFTSREGDDARYGKEVHTALENYVRDGTPLPRFYEGFRNMVDPLLEIAGTRYCEHEMALDIDRKPCDFHGEDYWVRGVADLLIVDGDTAFIVDYKTGKPTYADPNQLKLMALMRVVMLMTTLNMKTKMPMDMSMNMQVQMNMHTQMYMTTIAMMTMDMVRITVLTMMANMIVVLATMDDDKDNCGWR